MSQQSLEKNSRRFLRRDGSLNVTRPHGRQAWRGDLYHSLLRASWLQFFGIVLATYFFINVIFACAYFFAGQSALDGSAADPLLRFSDDFFFSVQTLATIGYGRLNPVGLLANALVSVEALLGLMGVAIMTGLLFARFSKPTARVVFSDKAIIGTRRGRRSFYFRMANERLNQIAEARVRVVMARNEITVEGEDTRILYDLKLERDISPMFSLSWTVSHIIDEKSPLYGLSHDDFLRDQVEIVISLTGHDETFSAPIYKRFSYTADDIAWNGYYQDIMDYDQDGRLTIDIEKIHDLVA